MDREVTTQHPSTLADTIVRLDGEINQLKRKVNAIEGKLNSVLDADKITANLSRRTLENPHLSRNRK